MTLKQVNNLNLTLFTIFFQVNEKKFSYYNPTKWGNSAVCQIARAKTENPNLKSKSKIQIQNPDFVPKQNGEKVQCTKLQKWLCYKYK